MKPLSIITHIKSNMKRLVPTILTLGLEFGALVFMVAIGIGQIYSVEHNTGGFLYKFAYATTSTNTDKKQITEIPGVDKVINAQIDYASAMLPLMNCGIPFIKVETNDMKYIIDKFNAKIIAGRLPISDNEIIVNKESLHGASAKLNDNVGVDYGDALYLKGNYKIVGVVDAEYKFCMAPLKNAKNNNMLFIGIQNGREKDVENGLLKIKDKFDNVYTFSDSNTFLTMIRNILTGLGVLAIGLFSLGIFISSMNLTKTNISSFKEEYSLLRALGYKEKFIAKRISSQLAIILSLSALLGVGIGTLLNVAFNNVYCVQRGIVYNTFSIYLIIIPMGVSAILYLTSRFNIVRIVKKMNFMSEIDI